MFRPLLLASALTLVAIPGCRPTTVKPPYAASAAPSPNELLASATPRFTDVRVPSAKVRVGRSIAGNLMVLAQHPQRFTGQIQVAGKELISLAFHEQGYTLRYLAGEGLPSGFYAGPPSECAVRELVGVPLTPEALVQLVLGGLPIPPGTPQVLGQGWDKSKGHEVLTIRVGHIEQALRFAYKDGQWWPAGGTQWQNIGGTRIWDWTIEHTDLQRVEGAYLPKKTTITRPLGGDKTQVVSIKYREVLPSNKPATTATPNEQAGDDDGWDDDGGWETEGDGGWETEGDEAWETGGDQAGEVDVHTTKSEAKAKPEPTPQVVIPPQFILTGGDLPARGDVCATRRRR